MRAGWSVGVKGTYQQGSASAREVEELSTCAMPALEALFVPEPLIVLSSGSQSAMILGG